MGTLEGVGVGEMLRGGQGDMVPMPPDGEVEAAGTVAVVVVLAGVVSTLLKLVEADDAVVPGDASEVRLTGAGVYIARGAILIEGLT